MIEDTKKKKNNNNNNNNSMGNQMVTREIKE